MIRYKLCYHRLTSSHTHCINLKYMEDKVYFEIPKEISRYHDLFDISEITKNQIVTIDYVKKYKRDGRRPWIELNIELLNKEIGYHIYKFGFINPKTKDITSLYFTYLMQDDNPEKPYVYMDRSYLELEKDKG